MDDMRCEKEAISCSLCGYKSAVKGNIKRHKQAKHANKVHKYMAHEKTDGKYKCKVCPKSYTHSAKHKIHYKRHHSEGEIRDKDIDVAALKHQSLRRNIP